MTRIDSADGAIPLVALRHALHEAPELSRKEAGTAAIIAAQMKAIGADKVLSGLGGHGIAAVFEGAAPGPTICLRAELDALPITEAPGLSPRSATDGVAHLCGHDGHMTILVGAARALAADRPAKGRVVALFQPAEEDGSGAAAVAGDERFRALGVDMAFALHNMPGLPLGALAITAGPTTCASRGMRLTLNGRTAHASEPQKAVSPIPALSGLMRALDALGQGTGPADKDFTMVTVTHASMGAEAFGITPGDGTLLATLRTRDDAAMANLVSHVEALVAEHAGYMPHTIGWQDVFVAMNSTRAAADVLANAAEDLGLERIEGFLPIGGSEDFGGLGAPERALGFIGSGDGPSLHEPDYAFPDALIPIGAHLLEHAARVALGDRRPTPEPDHTSPCE